MLKWTILISGLLTFGGSQILGQQSDQIKWYPTGKFVNFGGSHYQTIAVDDQSVTYHKIEAGMRLKASDVIVANHSFEPIHKLSVMPGGKSGKSEASQLAILSVRNGKKLALDAISGFSKGLISNKLSYKVLDEDFSAISEVSPLKQPNGGFLPVNMVDLANPFSNRPYQLIENEDGVIMAYVSSENAESNLHIGLAKFDDNFNLVFNQLYEIDMPANRLLDFRVCERAIDGSYYVIVKETLEKKPASKIQMPGPNTSMDRSRFYTNEERRGINRIYKLDETGLGNSYQLDGEMPTPALRILDNGSVLLAGLKNDGAQNRFTGAYSIRLDSELKEVGRAEQAFTEMYSNNLESFKTKEKGLDLNVRHMQILELGEKLVFNVELFGSITEEVVTGGRSTYNYKLLVGDNLLFQMEKSGEFTGLFSAISKDQLEYGGSQFYSGSYLFVKDDVLHILFNDHKDNLSSSKKERWNHMDHRKGNSVVREVKLDNNLNTVSDGVVSSGEKSVVMIVATAHFANGNLALFGADSDSYYGAVVK